MTMTVCGALYQMPAIFAFSPSSIRAITVGIAITGDELDNAANNSAVLSCIQAVHPTVFHWLCFNNSLNSAIMQSHPTLKTDTSMINTAFNWHWRWFERVYSFKV